MRLVLAAIGLAAFALSASSGLAQQPVASLAAPAAVTEGQPAPSQSLFPVGQPADPLRVAAAFDEPTTATLKPPVIPYEQTARAALQPPGRVFGEGPVYGRDPIWKPSWVKQSRGTFTYTPAGDDGLNWTSLNLLVGLKRPTGRAFTITPNLGLHFTDGPDADPILAQPSEIPGTLYDASLDFNVGIPLSPLRPGRGPEWIMSLGVSPGFYTDGENTTSDAVRFPGRALVIWNTSEQWSWVFGAVFLDRDDVSILPAVGFSWQPNADFKLDAMMPRPKMAYRFQRTNRLERWLTLSGEFGGGQWAIQRRGPDFVMGPPPPVPTMPGLPMPMPAMLSFNGEEDTVTLRSINLLIGVETRTASGITWAGQFGIVTGRELEYESGIGDRELDSTALFRLVSSF